jgi:hypothetical protein
MKWRRMRWTVMFCAWEWKWIRVLVEKHDGKKLLGRPRRRWEDNINIVPEDVGWEALD